ncbi:hypothetical protein [Spirosoma sordidisoli]|uniref:Uncharacterized protein n=1 Tax=Spirosoma sordidisoli TaxID=2502893 RepID=A0A4Q2UEP4_9BACT|nr:hypothetical protein [Spirosoma sordidisoli]RYC67723.1 hypothetical protein EQG79_23770 [Spirosoma sordidisoli]
MQADLADYIDVLTPWLSTDLISDDYLSRIRQIGRRLPALSFGCFECWLGQDQMRVDLNLAITGKVNEHQVVIDWLAATSDADDAGHQAVLDKIRSICGLWGDSRFILHPHIKVIWLVYDITDPLRRAPAPWLYIHFRRNRLSDDALVRPELVLQTVTLLNDQYPRERFRPFFESIAPAVQICSIGAPTSRDKQALRVYLMMQSFSDLLQLLIDHHWPGNLAEFSRVMSPYADRSDFFGLSIDIRPELQPRIGIECWFAEDQAQEKLADFTRQLVADKLCSTQKRDALLGWNGQFEVQSSPGLWSWYDPEADAPRHDPKPTVIRRMAQYVKLTYQPGKPLLAKGYLYFDRSVRRPD